VTDLTINGSGKRLTVGLRRGELVLGISTPNGEVDSIALPAMTARRLTEWLAGVKVPEPTPAQMLRVCAEALAAHEDGKFAPATSRELWDRGFDAGSDDCSLAQGDDWIAIYEPASMELEIYYVNEELGLTDCARVSTGTGQMVRM